MSEKLKIVQELLRTVREKLGIHKEEAAAAGDPAEAAQPTEFTGKDGKKYRTVSAEVGQPVEVLNGEAWEPAPDGDIEQEDGTVISVKDGLIASITPPAAADDAADQDFASEEPAADAPPAVATVSAEEHQQLKNEVESLRNEIRSLNESISHVHAKLDGFQTGLNANKAAFGQVISAVEELAGASVEQPLEPNKSVFAEQTKKEKASKKLDYIKASAELNKK